MAPNAVTADNSRPSQAQHCCIRQKPDVGRPQPATLLMMVLPVLSLRYLMLFFLEVLRKHSGLVLLLLVPFGQAISEARVWIEQPCKLHPLSAFSRCWWLLVPCTSCEALVRVPCPSQGARCIIAGRRAPCNHQRVGSRSTRCDRSVL